MAQSGSKAERRGSGRRKPSEARDVTRGEHDNLYGVVVQHGESLKRIESDLKRILKVLRLTSV
jgi:hypothetical protein